MKKIIIYITISFMILFTTGCHKKEVNNIKSNPDIIALYEKYLKDEKYQEKFGDAKAEEYTIKDISGDDIPELIVNGHKTEDRFYTLIVAYNKESNEVYNAYGMESSSSLLYNKEENTVLFISRGIVSTIVYNYGRINPGSEGLSVVKEVRFSFDKQVIVETSPDGDDKELTSDEAKKESQNYTFIGFDKTINGKDQKVKNIDIFENYPDNGFNINGKTLKYGTYQAQKGNDLEITLFSDGTCRYKGESNAKSSKTYDVGCIYTQTKYNNYGTTEDGILFILDTGDEEYFGVTIDNNFFSDHLDLNFVK